MTIPEDICVSLDYAKRLKEAGWLYPSLFYWDSHAIQKTQGGYGITEDGEFAAPTAEEILRRLPKFIESDDGRLFFSICCTKRKKNPVEWSLRFANAKWCRNERVQEDVSLVCAAAAMWVYLKENNLLPPEPHE